MTRRQLEQLRRSRAALRKAQERYEGHLRQCIDAGHTAVEIAKVLGISEHGVRMTRLWREREKRRGSGS